MVLQECRKEFRTSATLIEFGLIRRGSNVTSQGFRAKHQQKRRTANDLRGEGEPRSGNIESNVRILPASRSKVRVLRRSSQTFTCEEPKLVRKFGLEFENRVLSKDNYYSENANELQRNKTPPSTTIHD
jgi:hypothetical protein